jgi:hypothetical protein|tara:strand:- start:6465 stop:7670 length:1206 start_codon:yes stop_codon:yes gene_type:complete
MATQTSEQTIRLAPFQEDFLADIFESAKSITKPGEGSMPYSAQQLAGLSQGQRDAITQATQGVGSFSPYLQRGSEAIGQGIGAVGTGLSTLGSALGQLPEAQQGYRQQQQAMLDAQQLGQQGVGQAQAMTAGASYDFDPTSYQQFMDPYMESVIQQQYQDIAEQGDIAKNKATAQAVGSGAFGGSRGAIQQAEINQNVLDQQARTGSQLRSQGFQQAQNLAQQAASRQAQQQLAQAGQFGQQAGQAGALGFQGAAGFGQAAQGLGNLAQLTGQLGQTTGALGSQIGQMGTQTAALGQLGQQMGVQDVNTLLGIGGLQQGQDQKSLDIARANSLAQQALPYQRIGFMSDIFRGVPALQQTTSRMSTPPPSRGSQMLGLGIAGLGAVGQAGGFGNFFGGPRAT